MDKCLFLSQGMENCIQHQIVNVSLLLCIEPISLPSSIASLSLSLYVYVYGSDTPISSLTPGMGGLYLESESLHIHPTVTGSLSMAYKFDLLSLCVGGWETQYGETVSQNLYPALTFNFFSLTSFFSSLFSLTIDQDLHLSA